MVVDPLSRPAPEQVPAVPCSTWKTVSVAPTGKIVCVAPLILDLSVLLVVSTQVSPSPGALGAACGTRLMAPLAGDPPPPATALAPGAVAPPTKSPPIPVPLPTPVTPRPLVAPPVNDPPSPLV